jgi:deoxyribose-phosphate aldolase
MSSQGGRIAGAALVRLIDHTLLKPDATRAQITQLCAEARQFGFASVCVQPAWVQLCARELAGGPALVCTVVGFPLGTTLTAVKAFEAQRCMEAGARELDMVIHVGALKSGDDAQVQADIRAVVETAHAGGAMVKVIIETALLEREEKIRACRLAQSAGADFVKTSTGFASGGATAEDVALMRQTVGEGMGVKAAGGIRTYADVQKMLAAGATRIGASAGLKIMAEAAQAEA